MIEGSDKREGRRLLRRAANLCATVSGSSMRARDVTVVDLTGYGCRIESVSRYNAGDRLVLTIDPIGPVSGTVIWWTEGELGIEFAQPLHPAVIDHIRRTNAGPARLPETGVWTLRDYPV